MFTAGILFKLRLAKCKGASQDRKKAYWDVVAGGGRGKEFQTKIITCVKALRCSFIQQIFTECLL